MKRNTKFYQEKFVAVTEPIKDTLPKLRYDRYSGRFNAGDFQTHIANKEDGRINYIQNKLAGKHTGDLVKHIIKTYPAMADVTWFEKSASSPFQYPFRKPISSDKDGNFISFELLSALAKDIKQVADGKAPWKRNGNDQASSLQTRLNKITINIRTALARWRETYNFDGAQIKLGSKIGIYDLELAYAKDFSKPKEVIEFSRWGRKHEFVIIFPYCWERNVKSPEVSDKFIVNQTKIDDVKDIYDASLYKVSYLEGGYGNGYGVKSLKMMDGYLAQTNDGKISGLSKTEKYAVISLKKGVSRAFNNEIGV